MTDVVTRLRSHVEALATPNGRQVGTTGHERAKGYLVDRLAQVGLEPYDGPGFALPYRRGGVDFANLVAVAPGLDRSLPPLLLGAHYDTAGPLPGADDNAAAVAIVLEVAGRLLDAPFHRDVIIALFDAEEPPHYLTDSMGSSRFYRHQRRSEIHAALILDLVGHDVPLPGLENLLFITGMESSPCFEPVIRAAADREDLRLVTALNRYVGDVSDHHAFRLGGTPYLFFSCGRWEHYHAPSDTPEKLAYSKMASVATLLEGILGAVAPVEECVPSKEHDTTETDLALMRASLGSVAREMGLRLESRADIDRFAGALNRLLGI